MLEGQKNYSSRFLGSLSSFFPPILDICEVLSHFLATGQWILITRRSLSGRS